MAAWRTARQRGGFFGSLIVRHTSSILAVGFIVVMVSASWGSTAAVFGGSTRVSASNEEYAHESAGAASNPPAPFGIDGAATGGTISGSTVSATLTTKYSNDLILVFLSDGASSPAGSCSDAKSLSWTDRMTNIWQGSYPDTFEMYAKATSALSSDKITCSIYAGGNVAMVAFGVSGANLTAPFDSWSSFPLLKEGTTSAPSMNVTTTYSPDLLLGFLAVNAYLQYGEPVGLSQEVGLTDANSSTGPFGEVAATPIQATAGYPVSWVWTGKSSPWAFIGDAIRGAVIGTTEGYNWAGYVAGEGKYSVRQVDGSWIQPTVAGCSGRGADSSLLENWWVGMDGFFNSSSETVEQIGTAYSCNAGTSSYYAWYQFYPSSQVQVFTISPGDKISASVVYNTSTGVFTLSLSDLTLNQKYSTSGTSTNALEDSAECIVEIGPTALNLFPGNQTSYFGTSSTGVANTCYAAIDSAQLLSFSALKAAAVELLTTSGVLFGQPSALSSGSFSVALTRVG